MNNIWLNRIGIILNFIAGFMIAPELIGIHRIRNFESFLEHNLKTITNRLDGLINKLKGFFKDSYIPIRDSLYIILTGLLTLVSISILGWSIQQKQYWIIFVILLFIYGVLVISGLLLINIMDDNGRRYDVGLRYNPYGSESNYKPKSFRELIRQYGLRGLPFLLIAGPLFALFAYIIIISIILFIFILFIFGSIIIPPIILLPMVIATFFHRIIRFILNKLEGKSRLQSILVGWGIIFLIAGSLLQLLATF